AARRGGRRQRVGQGAGRPAAARRVPRSAGRAYELRHAAGARDRDRRLPEPL
ncbi:MAG: hypothetical protein AVDCRST_MAG91-1201, partial [uncultured Sphingomonadaceae bacterium]